MNDKYRLVHNLVSAGYPPIGEPVSDLLIARPSIFVYVNRNFEDDVRENGLFSPSVMLKRYPNYTRQIYDRYNTYLNHPVHKHCIFAFLSRIPNIPSAEPFIKSNIPVRISINKLCKSDQGFKIFGIGFSKDKDIILKEPDLLKFSKQPNLWYNSFRRSKDPYFRDVPHAAIFSKKGTIPAFACKIV